MTTYQQNFLHQIELKVFHLILWLISIKYLFTMENPTYIILGKIFLILNIGYIIWLFVQNYFTQVTITDTQIEYKSGILFTQNDTFKRSQIHNVDTKGFRLYEKFLNMTNVEVNVYETVFNNSEQSKRIMLKGFDIDLFHDIQKKYGDIQND